MASFSELAGQAGLDAADLAWLQRLRADWQILADLSFADLVLWLRDRHDAGWVVAAQIRPTTGPTAYVDDVVGERIPDGARPLLDLSWAERRIVREGDPEWRDDVPVRQETIPVVRAGRPIAVVARNTNLLGVRAPSRLELSYLQAASDLTQMVAAGNFPTLGQRSDHADSPRVGDGFLRVDAAGVVAYASPNAQSVFRRLGLAGDLSGQSLAEVTRALVPPRARPDEETLSAVLSARAPRDVELAAGEVALIVRAIPLRPEGRHIGGLILVRDVTDLRRRDRELVTKDATIREIHHRVKNNLQTVAALLRLQARRIDGIEAKSALAEAVRRVGSIAIVHETLSQAVEEIVAFDEIADRLGAMVVDVGSLPGRVRVERVGTFGALRSEVANTLAMVLTELLQNAVEHGYPAGGEEPPEGPPTPPMGRVEVRAERDVARLTVSVVDDGRGLPAGFSLEGSTNLGLSIVKTLVASELGGRLEMVPASPRGTHVALSFPVDPA